MDTTCNSAIISELARVPWPWSSRLSHPNSDVLTSLTVLPQMVQGIKSKYSFIRKNIKLKVFIYNVKAEQIQYMFRKSSYCIRPLSSLSNLFFTTSVHLNITSKNFSSSVFHWEERYLILELALLLCENFSVRDAGFLINYNNNSVPKTCSI